MQPVSAQSEDPQPGGGQTMEKHNRSRMSLSRSVENVTRNPLCEWQETLETPPTEVEEHNVSHLVCVKARGKEEAHKKVREQGEVPTVSMDYKSFGEASTEEDKVTMIVVKDETTGCVACSPCLRTKERSRQMGGRASV